jgi:hypothetical protein
VDAEVRRLHVAREAAPAFRVAERPRPLHSERADQHLIHYVQTDNLTSEATVR